METVKSRDGFDPRVGPIRPIKLVLCSNHDYITYSGECSCGGKHNFIRYAVAGASYGYIHNTAGGIRTWKSASGARHGLKRYVEI